MSLSSATLRVHAGDLAESIAIAIADECGVSSRPGAQARADNGSIKIDFAPQEIAHLRASLNSALRLVQACHGALEATK